MSHCDILIKVDSNSRYDIPQVAQRYKIMAAQTGAVHLSCILDADVQFCWSDKSE